MQAAPVSAAAPPAVVMPAQGDLPADLDEPAAIMPSLTIEGDSAAPTQTVEIVLSDPPVSASNVAPAPAPATDAGPRVVRTSSPTAAARYEAPRPVRQASSLSSNRSAAQTTALADPARAAVAATPSKPVPSGPTIVFSDSHFVIASNGAIVLIGDDADLRANTGDASSGTVAIDVSGSTLTSIGSATPSRPAAAAAIAPTGAQSSYRPLLLGETASGRAVAIAGYEDHSVSVVGNDQIVLYDDSNVVIGRNGTVNANTGDTDSSGLNVVDVTTSMVRSGNSGDGEGGGEDSDVDADDGTGPDDAEDIEGAADVGADATAVDEVDDDAAGALTDGAEILDDAVPASGAPASSPQVGESPRASASVDDEDVLTSANGDDVTVIGGDGFDDVAIRSTGDRNIIVYDDSNLVIGGTGPANLQIGDSDTGGAVVMGVHNSIIEAGCEGDLCPLYRPVSARPVAAPEP